MGLGGLFGTLSQLPQALSDAKEDFADKHYKAAKEKLDLEKQQFDYTQATKQARDAQQILALQAQALGSQPPGPGQGPYGVQQPPQQSPGGQTPGGPQPQGGQGPGGAAPGLSPQMRPQGGPGMAPGGPQGPGQPQGGPGGPPGAPQGPQPSLGPGSGLQQIYQSISQKNPNADPALVMQASIGLFDKWQPAEKMAFQYATKMAQEQFQMQMQQAREDHQDALMQQRDQFQESLVDLREKAQDGRTKEAIDAMMDRFKQNEADKKDKAAKAKTAAQEKMDDTIAQVKDTIGLGKSIVDRLSSTNVGITGEATRGIETVTGVFGGDQSARELDTDIKQFAQNYQKLMSSRGFMTQGDRADIQSILGASKPGSNLKLAKYQFEQAMRRLVGKYKDTLGGQSGGQGGGGRGGGQGSAPAAPQVMQFDAQGNPVQ